MTGGVQRTGRAARRHGLLCVLLALLPFLPVPARAVSPALPATYRSSVLDSDVMVRMRDGVLLATDVYRPADGDGAAAERWPVLLHRTPYDKAEPATAAIARELARHGYVVMVQDTRGRHASQGVFVKYYDYDAFDGYDTIEWAAAQPYANGKVGMYGTSYAAHTQADAAKLHPPHLSTVVLNMGGMSSAWNHSVRFDGAFEMGRQLTWAWGQALEDSKDPLVTAMLSKENVTDWYSALPLRRGSSPLAVAPTYEGYYLDEATRADYDAHWQTLGMQWEKYYSQTADIPMLHVGGWYDIYLRGTIENFRALSAMKHSPIRLLIGPWTHHGNTADYAGDVAFGPAAGIADFDTGFHLAWFDFYLKGQGSGAATQAATLAPAAGPEAAASAAAAPAPVRYFMMGTGDGHRDAHGRLFHGGVWQDAAQWPPQTARRTTFFLHADGELTETAPAPAEQPSTTYRFDPEHPVPTLGGGVSRRLKDGAYDQRERADMPGSRPPYLPLRARSDVVVFETAPLTHDVAIAGPVDITLFASSTGTDTDFTAKLVDVYPPSADFPQGFDMNLTDGILRASYRDNSPTRHLLVAGRVYRLAIRPFDTANVFKKGHRIRLDISSSNFPRFDVNPNTGEPLGANRRWQIVANSVYHGRARASALTLWQIEVPATP
jgi:uncharacterized protein